MAGCHIRNDTVPPTSPSGSPTDQPSGVMPTTAPSGTLPDANTSTSFTLSSSGGSVPLSASGVGGTLQYPANNAFSIAGAFTLSTTAAPAIPSPAPSGVPLIYFDVQLSASVTFASAFTTSPVTFPNSYSTAGATFTETLYDETTGTPIGSPVTGSSNGQSVSFPSASNNAFTANAGDIYLFVISSS